ncbi:tumor necrosis factor receptor superfamily member 6-like [Physella acuta]|uniref:tumor necrosis factor receptor superfamily member 6-like n=1 Tax=Physella acuta TaxID=109671 RepID=UPI0027DCFB21|nr:tumor necrosis factor receptor superfamily member 6-like [Physella acuta]
MFIIVSVVILLTIQTNAFVLHEKAGQQITCQRGQYLNTPPSGNPSCEPCPEGTYNSRDNHTLEMCVTCSKADIFSFEYVKTDCTPTHDTVIRCIGHHYRVEQDFGDFVDGQCARCTICQMTNQYLVRDCMDTSDTICCPRENMVVKDVAGRNICTES